MAKRRKFYHILKLPLLCYHVKTRNQASIVCKASFNKMESNFEDCFIYIGKKNVTFFDLMLKCSQTVSVITAEKIFSLSEQK